MQIVIKCTCFYVNLIGSQINANKKFCLFCCLFAIYFFFLHWSMCFLQIEMSNFKSIN
mgnify:FL=1